MKRMLMNIDYTSTVPIEILHRILVAHAGAGARYVASRVCHLWRTIVIDEHTRFASKYARSLVGAETCCVRLALYATCHDNDGLVRWAVHDALATPINARALGILWEDIATRGSIACALAMYRQGSTWPISCACFWCEGRPGNGVRVCMRSAVIMCAVANHRAGLVQQFVRWGHLNDDWLTRAFRWLIAHEHIDDLDEYGRMGILTSLRCPTKVRASWAEVAASYDKPRSLMWLSLADVAPLDKRHGDVDLALIEATINRSVDSIIWLCTHGFLAYFARALSTAVASYMDDMATLLCYFKKNAVEYYRAHGTTLCRAVQQTDVYARMNKAHRVAVIARAS